MQTLDAEVAEVAKVALPRRTGRTSARCSSLRGIAEFEFDVAVQGGLLGRLPERGEVVSGMFS